VPSLQVVPNLNWQLVRLSGEGLIDLMINSATFYHRIRRFPIISNIFAVFWMTPLTGEVKYLMIVLGKCFSNMILTIAFQPSPFFYFSLFKCLFKKNSLSFWVELKENMLQNSWWILLEACYFSIQFFYYCMGHGNWYGLSTRELLKFSATQTI